ncbi:MULTISPECIES: hypothetical protein [Streptomyces]|uniref:hypothetical protein n=1 Tax=Streptomyces TaxID=1883 RepID=UPI001319158B|nr:MULTISPECIES: hypothetical protein [Streptomyces]QGZ47541.1 hypothetical protein GPZ77_03270 [Streptomyces sp. QHH-9511]GGT78815.1 hypothetical protein GCM10010272_23220 [Streptomyces lateritius]
MNDPRPRYDGPPFDPDEYSATVLGSHWFERPTHDVAPDRVEGEVLRFGPGVTATALARPADGPTAARIWHGTLTGHGSDGPPPRPRPRRLRRYALAGLVLLAVPAFLAWQRFGPEVSVRRVAVVAPPGTLGCDGTADVVAVVETDGLPGTVTYRWERSDGTTSGLLRERLARHQEQARLRLLWTFHGRGEYRATARLVIVSPTPHTASAAFTYRCA